jgi:hypothetical protein
LKPEKDEGPKKKIYSKEKEDVFFDPNIPLRKDLHPPANLDELSRKKLRLAATNSKYSKHDVRQHDGMTTAKIESIIERFEQTK